MVDKESGRVRTVTEIAIELRNALIAVGGERGWNETRQRWIERAARAAGISFRTGKAIFYCEPSDHRSSAVESLRAAAARKVMQQEDAAANDYADIASRLARLESTLLTVDPDFYRHEIDARRQSSCSQERAAPATGEDSGPVD